MKKKRLLENDEDAAEALTSRTSQDSDVEEDQEVADLSAIPTPKIGFKMPNLSSNKGTVAKKPLTANLLNNYVVNMRANVKKAKHFIEGQLKKNLKFLEKKKKLTEKEERHIKKINEELKAIRAIPNDDVSKFALVNKKTKNQLNLSSEVPVTERCLYHLATSKPILKDVKEFREVYSDWESRAPFILQRLGRQYRDAKPDKQKKTNANEDSNADDDDKESDKERVESDKEEAESDEEEAESDEEEAEGRTAGEVYEDEEVSGSDKDDDDEEGEDEGDNISDVEMGSGSEDEETIAERRKKLLELCGIKEDKSRPKIAPKPKGLVESDQEAVEDDEEESNKVVKPVAKSKNVSSNKKPITGLKGKLGEQEKRSLPEDSKTSTTNQTVIKKIKLSDGGIVELKKIPALEKTENSSEGDDDDDTNTGSSGFFLNLGATGNGSSGEESVDDDEDFKAVPLQKKGPRQMSKAREKLHEKLERRPEERRKKLQKQKQAILEKNSFPRNKAVPNPKDPETLHPSWAARVQKKKELENAQPQGRRKVFDDNDD